MTKFDPAWLYSMYNNRALVPDHEAHFSRWMTTSAQVRASQPRILDLPYGESQRETLDIFPVAQENTSKPSTAPVIVFIHGGYWRSLDKSDHSFIAPSLTQAGACVVVLNYDLCPAVTIPQITMQMVKALAWVYCNVKQYGGDPKRISVMGHSAGGHLAAMLLACTWKTYSPDLPADLVKKALSISGLYDLEPLRHTPFLQESLKLTPQQVRLASPALLPRPEQGTLCSVAGADESEEFIRQNLMLQQAWGQKTVPVCETLPGLNHFSILEALPQKGHRLNTLALQLISDI